LTAGIDPQLLAAWAVKGAAHLERGVRDFAEWSKAMVAEQGEKIRPYLQSVWKGAKYHYERQGGDMSAAPAARAVAPQGVSKVPSIAVPEADRAKATNLIADKTPIHGAQEAYKYVKDLGADIFGIKRLSPFKKIMLDLRGKQQEAIKNIIDEAQKIKAVSDSKVVHEGMTNAADLGSDPQRIAKAIAQTKDPVLKAGYEAAAKLGPKEQEAVAFYQQWTEKMLAIGKKAGLFNRQLADLKPGESWNGVKNYVPHEFSAQGIKKFFNPATSGINRNFKFSKPRVYADMPAAEAVGLRVKNKNLPASMVSYGGNMMRAALSRDKIRELLTTTNERGEPLAQAVYGRIIGNDAINNIGKDQFVQPAENKTGIQYRTASANNEAFHNWPVKYLDADGKTHYSLGEIAFHPEHIQDINRIFGRSGLREWQDSPGSPTSQSLKLAFSKIDRANQFIKGNELGGFSTFHMVQEGVRQAMAGTNPLGAIEKVNVNNPEIQQMMRLGLTLVPDQYGLHELQEGLGGHSLIDKVPVLGKLTTGLAHFMFQEAIPSMKIQTARLWSARNLKLLAPEIAAGKLTREDVLYKTMQDVNDKFGGINKFDRTRDPTFQHLLGLAFLAPDFQEGSLMSNLKAARALGGSKLDRQPAQALALTAITAWALSRIGNQIVSGTPRYDKPFKIVAGGKDVGIRNEAGDLYNLYNSPRIWWQGRLSPIASTVSEAAYGTNWAGRKVDTSRIIKEFLAKPIPISLRGVPGFSNATTWGEGRQAGITPLEEFLDSQGMQITPDNKPAPAGPEQP
jgi:hypothetical protein